MATIAERVAALETAVANLKVQGAVLITLAQEIKDRFQEFKTGQERRQELEALGAEVERRKAKRRERRG